MTPPPLTKTRIYLAFTVAGFADLLQIPIHLLESNAIIEYLGIPVHFLGIPIDLFAAAVTIILIGFHPALLPSFIVKFVPAMAGLPTWTAAVGYVVWSRKHTAAPATTPNAGAAKPDVPKPPTNPTPAPSGLWILVIGATLIVAFIWSRHAPAERAVPPPMFVNAATRTPAPELARIPDANGKIIVAVGPMENLSSPTTPFSSGRGFDPATGLPASRKQSNPNAEAICGILEDQLTHIDGIEIVGKEQMRALRSQLTEAASGMSEAAKTAKLRSLFPANYIVLLAILDIHDQKQDFNGYGIKSTTVKTTCSLRTQVMNTADGTITFSKIFNGAKSESKSDAAATSSTDDPGFEAAKDALQKLDNDTDFKNALRGKTPTTPTTIPNK